MNKYSSVEFSGRFTEVYVPYFFPGTAIKHYHDNPEKNSSNSGEGLEEPVADGGLVVCGKVELVGQAVQVLNGLGGNMVKVDLQENEIDSRDCVYKITVMSEIRTFGLENRTKFGSFIGRSDFRHLGCLVRDFLTKLIRFIYKFF